MGYLENLSLFNSFKKTLLDVIIMDNDKSYLLLSSGNIDKIRNNNKQIKNLESSIEELKKERDYKIEMYNKQIEEAENDIKNCYDNIKISYNEFCHVILCNMDDNDDDDDDN